MDDDRNDAAENNRDFAEADVNAGLIDPAEANTKVIPTLSAEAQSQPDQTDHEQHRDRQHRVDDQRTWLIHQTDPAHKPDGHQQAGLAVEARAAPPPMSEESGAWSNPVRIRSARNGTALSGQNDQHHGR